MSYGTAVLSDDGLYRYELTRGASDLPGSMALWIMLNPSVADAERDDPTVRKCVGFTLRWRLHGLAVVNLYALRSSDPDDLERAADPYGPENRAYLEKWLSAPAVGLVVAAWGARGRPRAVYEAKVMAAAHQRPLWCLGTTSGGQPRHPARLGYARPLVPLP